ncbi:MAG TPA: hypothetical protein VJN96_19250 [Vicinamibacterales bacterium]|nr:hypothetical protein [Vicinamibacterales bacterium]
MTVAEFDRGYWYATDLTRFATRLGVRRASQLRKDELEHAIRTFLASGRVKRSTGRPPSTPGTRDVERGLTMARRVVVYTNDKKTKAFLEAQARRIDRAFVRRSGARYRLNRWRERQLARGRKITYGDLVREYVRLCRSPKPFARVPHDRYVYFISDFRKAHPKAGFAEAVRAWHALKRLPVSKTYRAWKTVRH